MGLDLNPNRSSKIRSGTLPFHFWGCAITACTREVHAKFENALEEEAVDALPTPTRNETPGEDGSSD